MKSRIMYIERKASALTGEARIGRVTFNKTGRTILYRDHVFRRIVGGGFKSNYRDEATGEDYWISGPKRRGGDHMYGSATPTTDFASNLSVQIGFCGQRSKMASVKAVLIVVRFLVALGLLVTTTLPPSEGNAANFTSTSLGFSFVYPDEWNMTVRSDSKGLWLRSFPLEEMPSGAFVPEGGATISLFVYPPFNDVVTDGATDDSIIDIMIEGDVVLSRTRLRDGHPARAVSVLESWGARFVHTLIHKQGKLFRLVLTCNVDDPKVSTYDQVLDSIIASLTLLPAK